MMSSVWKSRDRGQQAFEWYYGFGRIIDEIHALVDADEPPECMEMISCSRRSTSRECRSEQGEAMRIIFVRFYAQIRKREREGKPVRTKYFCR